MGGLLVLQAVIALLGGRTHHEGATLDLDHPHAIHDLSIQINDGSKGRRHACDIVGDKDSSGAFGLARNSQTITIQISSQAITATSDRIRAIAIEHIDRLALADKHLHSSLGHTELGTVFLIKCEAQAIGPELGPLCRHPVRQATFVGLAEGAAATEH